MTRDHRGHRVEIDGCSGPSEVRDEGLEAAIEREAQLRDEARAVAVEELKNEIDQ